MPELIHMSVVQDVVSSDHFPICLELSNHAIEMYKSLLERAPLRFNSSLLFHSLFDAYMVQILGTFSTQVNVQGCHAWDITLQNITDVHRMYGLNHAQRRRHLIREFSHVLGRCTAALMYAPHDEELLDVQCQLQDIIRYLTCQSYQSAKLRQLQDGIIDNQSQSHRFFQELYPSYARYNVVQVKQGVDLIVDPIKVIDICIKHFKDLIGPQLVLNDDVMQARHQFYNVVGGVVNDSICAELDADFLEEEVETVLLHLPNGKSPGWDGITNEVFKKYATILKTPFTLMFQQCWDCGFMPESWKVGLIKLIPKVPSPESFNHWRPISLMGGLYKVFTKTLANRLKKYLPQLIHPTQYGFIAGRNILHNVLNVQMATDYARHTNQEVIMVQLDLEKAYDHVNWSFLSHVMHSMGFGPRMSRLIYLLGQNATSCVMLNGGVTAKIPLTRSVRQGCPLSPLLFAIVTHPVLVMLSKLADDGNIVGLHLPSGGQLVAQALADDSFMFLQASKSNLEKSMHVWDQFALASGLHINWRKSRLISCTESDLQSLGWQGSVIHRGSIFRHLGYPLGVDVTNAQLLEWIGSKLRDKFMYWKSQSWPFHVRLKVVQCIMIPMILYFLPLLPWTKKALQAMLQPLRFMLWRKKDRRGVAWVSWEHLATPKRLGGVTILNLDMHLMARRFSLLRDMCRQDQPWVCMMQYFIENAGFIHGKTKIKASWWHLLNGSINLKVRHSVCAHHLVRSWKETLSSFEWKPPVNREQCNSLQTELLVSSRLLCWQDKEKLRSQFNRLFRLGVVKVSDVIDSASQRLLDFAEAKRRLRIPPNYDFIWQSLQGVTLLQGCLPVQSDQDPWVDWCLKGGPGLLTVTTNILYHHSIGSLSWVSSKAQKEWNVYKSDAGWWQILQRSWCCTLPYKYKVFIWRVMVGGLPLGSALKRRDLGYGTCFFCTIPLEDNTHRFIQCPVAQTIWKYISEIWQVLSRCYLRPKQWVFAQYVQNRPSDDTEIMFQFLRYWGLRHNWDMRNAFIFDGVHGVQVHIRKLKGILLWQFWVLQHVGIVSSSSYSSLLMVVQNVPLPM